MKPENWEVISGGSPWFVELLEELLVKAKSGELKSIAVVWQENEKFSNDWVLSPNADQIALLGALRLCADGLADKIRNK